MNSDDDDSPAFYMLGLATGLGIGIALAAPSAGDLVISLDASDYEALASPAHDPALEERICQRIQAAFAERLESGGDLAFICADGGTAADAE